jgi:hypothetical protein
MSVHTSSTRVDCESTDRISVRAPWHILKINLRLVRTFLTENIEMKALLVLVAVASTAYVGYSYNSTNGESCLVCPMTGESVFASTGAEPEPKACCAFCAAEAEATLTAVEGEGSETSTTADECHGNCEKDCCKDKEAAADQEDVVEAGDSEEEVAAEATEAE